MSLSVFLIVLLAALLHAVWNLMVKGNADKATGMAGVVFGQGLCGLVLLPMAPAINWECWPYLIAGAVLHLGYQLVLIRAYRIGDLTEVYPLARGASPLLVALGTALFFGARFSQMELTALLLISVGIASIILVSRRDRRIGGHLAGLALLIAAFIAAYSVVDGQGARIAGTALGFFASLTVINAVLFAGVMLVSKPNVITRAVRDWPHMLAGGAASFVAYALVVWAFTQAPIALVTALRETSIIFALLLGVFVLGEKLSLAKVVATFFTLFGAVLLKLSRT